MLNPGSTKFLFICYSDLKLYQLNVNQKIRMAKNKGDITEFKSTFYNLEHRLSFNKWIALCLVLLSSLFMIQFNRKAPMQKENNNEKNLDNATFGAGCFWCTEAFYSRLNGVIKVEPGYSGGNTPNPTYKDVCTGKTGYAEVCQITFDPKVISYSKLLEVFWGVHDPTTLNRQGNDVGTQYRSVVFYHNDEQKKAAEEMKAKLESDHVWDDPIVTQIVPFEKFYPAEAYHDDYFEKNPDQPYCSYVIAPKVKKFEKVFGAYLK
jgi:peptide-methionine (S)-S-oxide reductase